MTSRCDDPGCPGYFTNSETNRIERCDACGIFVDDYAASTAAGFPAEALRDLDAELVALHFEIREEHTITCWALDLPGDWTILVSKAEEDGEEEDADLPSHDGQRVLVGVYDSDSDGMELETAPVPEAIALVRRMIAKYTAD